MFETYYPSKKVPGQLGVARWMAQVLGVRQAAQYMRDRKWSLEAALFNLLGIAKRNHRN